MKNYYDELEVNKTASKEVIEKVYKFLAKKYHPDTTKEIDKQAAEERFKAISEAYDVLSDDKRRKQYDLELEQNNFNISYEEYMNIVNERNALLKTVQNLKASINKQYNYNYSNIATTNHRQTTVQNNINNSINNRTLFSLAYIKQKIKDLLITIFALICSIIITLSIIFILSHFNLISFLS